MRVWPLTAIGIPSTSSSGWAVSSSAGIDSGNSVTYGNSSGSTAMLRRGGFALANPNVSFTSRR